MDEILNVGLEARYNIVYRQQGIRFINQLKNPKLYPISQLEPFDFAMYHYFVPRGEDVETYGISQDHPLLRLNQYRYGVYHIGAFTQPIKGPSQKKFFNYRLAEKSYHKHNKRLYWLRTMEKVKVFSKKRPWEIIVDYSMMGRNTKFRPNLYRFLNEFQTTYSNYLYEAGKIISTVPNRRHLLMLHVPDTIPSLNHLRMASKELKKTYHKFFPSYKELALLDFWRWISVIYSKDSLFANYIKEKDFDNIELLVVYKNHASFVNLGLIYKWFSGKEPIDDVNEAVIGDDDDEDINVGASRKFQKWFYLFLTRIVEKQKEYEMATAQIKDVDVEQTKSITQIYDTSTDETLKDEDVDVADMVPEGDVVVSQTTDEIKNSTPDNYVPPSDDGSQNTNNVEETESSNTDTISGNFAPASLFGKDSVPDTTVSVGIFDNFRPEKIARVAPVNATATMIVDNHSKFRREEENLAFGFTQREKDYWDKQANVYKTLKSPVDKKKTLEEYLNESPSRKIEESDVSIPDIPLVIDKNMLNKSTKALDKKYIKEHLKRDTLKCILSAQRTGINITNYEVEDISDVAGGFEEHVIQFTPVGGSPSTVRLKIPKVDPDTGYIYSSGVAYSLRKQRVDAFLRKVGDNKVAMTSYYGKLFFNRNEHRKYDQAGAIYRLADQFTIEGVWHNVQYGVCHTTSKNVPSVLQPLMARYKSFSVLKPHGRPDEYITVDLSNIQDKGDKIVFGHGLEYHVKKDYFIYQNQSYPVQAILGYDATMIPDTYAEVKILGEMIPVGWILARWLGFMKLVDVLGLTPDKTESTKRVTYDNNYLVLRFADERWAFDKRHMTARDKLIIGGFLKYNREIKHYSIYDFDSQDIYGAIMMQTGIAVRYERELDLIYDMFIDPITYEYLVQKGESTDIVENFIKAVELLTTSHFVTEINMNDMLIKGHERVAGAAYRALVTNLRQFKSKAITHKRKFQMGPMDAWMLLANDPAMEIVDEINPLQNVKERTNITFLGEGGRSRRSMVQGTRSYDDSDIGVISEASVDSQDVGVTTFLSAAPKLTDTFGNSTRTTKEDTMVNVYSTPVMMVPFSTSDDRHYFLSSE